MADSTDGDSKFQNLGFLVPTLIAFFFGLVIHLFIIVINVSDWWEGRSVTSVDHIVTSLGISRLFAQFTNVLYYLVTSFLSSQNSHVTLASATLLHINSFFFYSNLWLTTLLSIVYCLKISNLRTRLFLYLRGAILPRTDHLIVASGLLSAFYCLIILWKPHTEIHDEIYNTTMDNQGTVCIYMNSMIHFTIGIFIPLLFYYISSVLLFTSLYHHTVKMKRSSNLSINLETYYSAMKLVSFTFIYNTVFFSGYLVCVFYYNVYCEAFAWPCIFLYFLPTLHSLYLIYRTAKLQSQMSKVLQNVINCFY